MRFRLITLFVAAGAAAMAQTATGDAASKSYTVQQGTKIPLSMINSISTKHAAEGDRIYLESVFPIMVDGKIVVPPGSYVAGTVTQVKRPGKVKGRAELYVRFDSLMLPNGVTREFKSRIGALDGRASEELNKDEGRIKSEGNKSGDLATIATTTGTGAGIGSLAGIASGHTGMGAGIGAAAGAAAGLMTVLLTRGPDAVLARGTTLEMVLDRPLIYETSDLDFNVPAYRRAVGEGSGPMPSKKASTGRRFPFGGN